MSDDWHGDPDYYTKDHSRDDRGRFVKMNRDAPPQSPRVTRALANEIAQYPRTMREAFLADTLLAFAALLEELQEPICRVFCIVKPNHSTWCKKIRAALARWEGK